MLRYLTWVTQTLFKHGNADFEATNRSKRSRVISLEITIRPNARKQFLESSARVEHPGRRNSIDMRLR